AFFTRGSEWGVTSGTVCPRAQPVDDPRAAISTADRKNPDRSRATWPTASPPSLRLSPVARLRPAGLALTVPEGGQVVAGALADAVVVQDVLGGSQRFLMVEDDRLRALVV